MSASLFLYAAVVTALLTAEYSGDVKAQRLFKPLAALGFILLALYFGALETLYGQVILAGLIFCAFGDVFLLARKSPALFMAGMAAFALGHIAYCFALQSIGGVGVGAWTIVLTVTAVSVFFLYLRPKLDMTMQIMVGLYAMIIGAMVIFALSTGRLIPALASVMFAASDMCVARDRFVKTEPRNALGITPFYFGAQALFAFSVN